jgi:hypothetical protein
MWRNVIIHGDSRDYIPGVKTPINCVLTDPPFGIDNHMNSGHTRLTRTINSKIVGDTSVDEAIDLFCSVMEPIIPKLADEAEIYVFTAWNVLDAWMPAVRKLDPEIHLKMMLIWQTGYPGKGDLRANWGCGYEPILYLKKGRRRIPKRRSAVIAVDKVMKSTNIHPHEKPVQLLRQLIEMSTDPGDLVVDPFSGSGSTSVACQQTMRNSLAFEIDERWIGPSRARLDHEPLI